MLLSPSYLLRNKLPIKTKLQLPRKETSQKFGSLGIERKTY